MSRARRFDRWKLVIPTIAVIGWGYIIFWPNDHPDMFPILAGCYSNKTNKKSTIVRVLSTGELSSGGLKTSVSIKYDKQGYSFLPKEKVVASPTGEGRITTDDGYPLLLRIGTDDRNFAVPDENGPDMIFEKIAC